LGGLDERYEVEKKLEHIYHQEEVYWQQRTSMKWTIKGDSNSWFYHLYSNGRRRKSTISYLETDVGVYGAKDLIPHIMDFYQSLFGPNTTCSMKLTWNFWGKRPKISKEGMDSQVKHFEDHEIKQAIDQIHEDSAPGPDGSRASFFKKILAPN
jgi:hypothetical protein